MPNILLQEAKITKPTNPIAREVLYHPCMGLDDCLGDQFRFPTVIYRDNLQTDFRRSTVEAVYNYMLEVFELRHRQTAPHASQPDGNTREP